MNEKNQKIEAQFHLGAEKTSFDAEPTQSIGVVKQKALEQLRIVIDPSFDYLLKFQGETIADETQSLSQLLGGHIRPHVEFHIIKRPKGGSLDCGRK